MLAYLVSMTGKALSSTEDSVAFFHLKKHKGMGGPLCSGLPCAPTPLRVSDRKLYTPQGPSRRRTASTSPPG